MFFYYTKDKTSGWVIQSVRPGEREALIERVQPKYVTVLNLSEDVTDDMPLDEVVKVRYQGPFYADWDCPEIEEGIDSVKRFLTLLKEEYEVNPYCVRLYATGGRGFHAEVPFALFSSTRNDQVQLLPYIYREIANKLYTEHLDLKVYSGRRGRMWRTPNVERETKGKYKVPISYDQLLTMTAESYDQLCSEPQPYPALAPVEAVSPKLATLYEVSRQQVEKSNRHRGKNKANEAILATFNGDWPTSVKQLMAGEIPISQEVGLNKIALQLSILTSALGKTQEQFIDACDGLIATYRGDGHKTRGQVRKELIRIFNYVDGNPCYSYTPSGIASIFEDPQDAFDVNGQMPTMDNPEAMRSFKDLTQGLILGSNGIYMSKGTESGRETNWHFDPDSVVELRDAHTLEPKGFTMLGMDSGVPLREINVDHGLFTSGDKTKSFLAQQGATAPKFDSVKAGGLLGLIMSSSRQHDFTLTVDKEGFVLVQNEEGDDLVWSSPYGCFARNASAKYRYRSGSGGEAGNFQSDLHSAPPLGSMTNAATVIEALLNINGNPYTVASTLGWYTACFLKVYYMKRREESFPLLQSYGESGSGKTATNLLMQRMFYYKNKARPMNAGEGTAYGRRVMFSSSTTVPLYIDEYKPRQMSQQDVRAFRALIHEAYTSVFSAPRGGGDVRSSQAGQWAELAFETKTTPLSFSTETAETETAIVERVISVPYDKQGREGHDVHFSIVAENVEVLSSLGRTVMMSVLNMAPDIIHGLIERSQTVSREKLGRVGNSRVTYNIGCVLSGIGLLEMVVKKVFPKEYTERMADRFATLRDALVDESNYPSLNATPELVKVLKYMYTVSHREDPNSDYYPRYGKEIGYSPQGDLDLDVESFYYRYRSACQRRGVNALFPDTDSYLLALTMYRGLIEIDPIDSVLTDASVVRKVVRISSENLASWGLGPFKI